MCIPTVILALQNGVDVKTVFSMLGRYSAGFMLDLIPTSRSRCIRLPPTKWADFMVEALPGDAPTPEPPGPPEDGSCKIIPYERVG